MKKTNYFTDRTFSGPLIKAPMRENTSLVIVIPVYNEPGLMATMESLAGCTPPTGHVEVILVINHSAAAPAVVKESNQAAYAQMKSWSGAHPTGYINWYPLYQPDLPARKAGVGLARKIGMDEAARRCFAINRLETPIICLDADCRVSDNYLVGLEQFFAANPDVEGCSIHFEHPLDGLDPWQEQAIIDYELHLRLMIVWQRWAGFPFAFQTVGSSMAVRAHTYVAVGGMNTRQAGEDFYFLHKVIERGAFADCAECVVYPSARTSDRVPFGTGRALLEATDKSPMLTHNPTVYRALKQFIGLIPGLRLEITDAGLPPMLLAYLETRDWKKKVAEIRNNTSSQMAFVKRFFRWFNAFQVMKFAHYARDNGFPDVPVAQSIQTLSELVERDISGSTNRERLEKMRAWARG